MQARSLSADDLALVSSLPPVIDESTRVVRQQFRKEQDAEFDHSLRIDREKAERCRRDEESLERLRARVSDANALVPPVCKTADRVQVAVRLLDGRRLERAFCASDYLNDIYMFVGICLGEFSSSGNFC